MIRILLVDDHVLLREGLRMVLDAQLDFEVVGEAANGTEAIDFVRALRPDVVLMDVNMPGMDGIEATKAIVAEFSSVRVIGLTFHEDTTYFFRMLKAGASGYLLKVARSGELVAAIRSVQQGGIHISAGIATNLESDFLQSRMLSEESAGPAGSPLTEREREIVRLLASGVSSQEIAELLHLSIHTVQSHRANITRKVGLDSRKQLLDYATRHRIV